MVVQFECNVLSPRWKSVVQARGLGATTKRSRQTKGKSKAQQSYFTHFTQKESQSQSRSLVAAQNTPPHPTCLALPRLVIIPPSFSLLSEVLAGNATARLRLRSNICTLSGRRFFSSPSSPHIKRFLSYSLYLPTLNGMPEGKTEDRVRHSFRKLTTFIEN